ncbi:unnamed protein product [Sphagnum balticum]
MVREAEKMEEFIKAMDDLMENSTIEIEYMPVACDMFPQLSASAILGMGKFMTESNMIIEPEFPQNLDGSLDIVAYIYPQVPKQLREQIEKNPGIMGMTAETIPVRDHLVFPDGTKFEEIDQQCEHEFVQDEELDKIITVKDIYDLIDPQAKEKPINKHSESCACTECCKIEKGELPTMDHLPEKPNESTP